MGDLIDFPKKKKISKSSYDKWPQRCPWCKSEAISWYPDSQPRQYRCGTEFHTIHFRSMKCKLDDKDLMFIWLILMVLIVVIYYAVLL